MRITQNSRSSLLHSEIISHRIIPSVRTSPGRSPRRRTLPNWLLAAGTLLFLLLAAATAFAGSATWNLNPLGNDWAPDFGAENWTPPKPGTLTMNSALIFNPRATYKCVLDRGTPKASKVVALRVTINGAQFTFVDTGTGTLATGTVFTVIRNTGRPSPISGTFSNLADGAVFTSNGNNFQANYEGGDGNDLTLTVVP
jgi:hypothetical protein